MFCISLFLDPFKELVYFLFMVSLSSKNTITSFLRSRLYELFGLSFFIFSITFTTALLTHHPTDPSWNLAADSESQNLLGSFGAITSDLFLQFFGSFSYGLALFFLGIGSFLFMRPKGSSLLFRMLLFLSGFLFLLTGAAFWEGGGAIGHILHQSLRRIPLSPLILSFSFLTLGLFFLFLATGLRLSQLKEIFFLMPKSFPKFTVLVTSLSTKKIPLYETVCSSCPPYNLLILLFCISFPQKY